MDNQTAAILANEDEKFAVINLVTPKVREAILSIPDELHQIEDHELPNKVRPNRVDWAIRCSFWREYERVVSRGSGRISAASIYGGICEQQYWDQKFLKNSRKVAWMIRPIQSYKKSMETILALGQTRLYEIMHAPVYDNKGQFGSKNASLILQALKMVDDRVKGMAIQRIEKKQQVSLSTQEPPVKMNELDKEIKTLEAELGSNSQERTVPQSPATEEGS
jgi:hypothetical protein